MTPNLDLGGAISTASVIISGAVALLGILGYQNRRAKLSAIRSAFSEAIDLLAAHDEERRLAAAILLRRFLDPRSEHGTRVGLFGRRAPYATEAQNVMAAVLRGLPRGDLQKLLADGLAYAPTLEKADLQRTNLQNAYLGPRNAKDSPEGIQADPSTASLDAATAKSATSYQVRLRNTVRRRTGLEEVKGSLEGADFFQADLSAASLKGANAKGAAFYQARLRNTVLRHARLQDANFFEADLSGANFDGAWLEGAKFASARNIPDELRRHIDDSGRYRSPDPAPAPAQRPTKSRHVFLSAPYARTPIQDSMCQRLAEILTNEGLVLDSLPRRDYPPSGALAEIARRMAGCAGVVVLGLRQDDSATDASRVGITPWTHIEAGLAYGQGLPLLLLRETEVSAGAFDDAVNGHQTHVVELGDSWNEHALRAAMAPWIFEVTD